METIHRFSVRLLPLSLAQKQLKSSPVIYPTRKLISRREFSNPPAFSTTRKAHTSSTIRRAGWLLGMGENKKLKLPEIVKAGDPVLHERAREVDPEEIGSERIQKIIDDMVKVMRSAPGVGLAAPQIGIPLRVSLNFLFLSI